MRHHYIPQFLLGAWARRSADRKVEVFRLDLPALPSSRRSPRATGYEEDLYALDRPTIAGMAKQAIETRLLKAIDNFAAIARQKLEVSGPNLLTSDEQCDWVNFIMSLKIRLPHNVDLLKSKASSNLRMILERKPEEYRRIRHKEETESMEEWLEQKFPGVIDNFGLSIFKEILLDEKTAQIIIQMRWDVIDLSSAKNELLLADEPCIFSHGISDDNLIIALPIAPNKLFIATKSDELSNTIVQKKSSEIVLGANNSSVAQSRARIYSTGQSSRRFIENRLWRLRRGKS